MTTIGYLKKKPSSEIDSNPWGLQYTARDYPHDLLMDLMGGSGAKWCRISTKWTDVEVKKGVYDWELMDQLVDGLLERGVTGLFLKTSTGSHPAYHDFPEGEYWPPTDEPAALDACCRYAAAMVEHFRDRVRSYEIYNEPNHPLFWRPEPDPVAYALLLRRVSEAIRAVDDGVRIIGGVLAGVGDKQVAYAKAFMSEPGTAEAMDILSYHPYRDVPETTAEQIAELRDAARAIKPGLTIWQGECGCPSSGDTIHARPPEPWGYNCQSKWLLRRLLTDYSLGAEISVYFLISEFHGNLHPGSPDLRTGYNTKGLTQHTTWAVKPAYYALQNLAATIDHTWKPVEEEAEIAVVDPGIFYGIGPHEDRFPCVPFQFAMRREGVPMLAYWLPWRPQELIRKATVRIAMADVSWNDPVCVDLLSGEVTEGVMVDGAVEVPMADYPMLLTERASLDLAGTPQQPSYDELVGKLRWTY